MVLTTITPPPQQSVFLTPTPPLSKAWVIRKSRVISKTITLMAVVILSLISWFPHILVFVLRTKFENLIKLSAYDMLNVRVTVWYFSYINSALNPFVYALRYDTSKQQKHSFM